MALELDQNESACGCDLCSQMRTQPAAASATPESLPGNMPLYPVPAEPSGRLIPRL
jgi:hypothetical protein